MRRVIAWLVVVGAGLLLIAWPLWHVTRPDTSGCGSGVPCDPSLYLPFGSIALVLTLVGGSSVLVGAVLLAAVVLRAVIRYDRRIRSSS